MNKRVKNLVLMRERYKRQAKAYRKKGNKSMAKKMNEAAERCNQRLKEVRQ